MSLLFGTYFIWEQTHEEHERYRLERLDGWSAEQALGALPSTREAMLKGFDNQNSYVEDYSEFLNRYYVNLSYRKNRGNHRNTLDIRVPLKFITDALVN